MSDAGSPASQVKRATPVHPVFFALVPTLTLFSSNLTLLPGGLVWRPFAVSIAFALAVWTVSTALFRNWEKGAVCASVFVVGFFFYSRVIQLFSAPGNAVTATVYCVVLAVLGSLAGWKFKATKLLNVFSVVLVGLFLSQVFLGLTKPTKNKSLAGIQAAKSVGKLPDVYYVILDGHGREDVLREMYGVEKNTLAQGLRERGFFVADKAHSNYVQTELSLASSLNMSHLSDVIATDPGENNRGPFDRAIDTNLVQRDFAYLGYELIGITTGFPAISFPQARTGYVVRSGFSLLETALIQTTPLAESDKIGESQFLARRRWLTNAYDALGDLSGESVKPKMVVAHILAPHPPFVFGPNGEMIRGSKSFTYADGSDYKDANPGGNYVSLYAGQEQYIAKLTLKAVDTILARSKVKPIIIIQGDHGPKSKLDQNVLSKTDINECFPILNAYYGPESLTKRLYPEITPVNSFRLVLSDLTGQEMKLLPDRSYYSPFGKPMELTDVTDRLTR
jgi:hypothetical protein